MSFRQAIQEILKEPIPQHPTIQQSSKIEKKSIKEQIANIRRRYTRARDAMTPERTRALQLLFAHHHLPWYEQLGAVWLLLQPDPQRPHFRRPYLALPFPTADLSTLQGLECRALGSIPRHLQRRTRSPQKTLWMLPRPHQPILLTESIFDCLAGDALFGPKFSLLALNGLPMLPQLPSFLSHVQPSAVYVALDNDRKADRGPRAQQEAIQMIMSLGIPAIDVRIHTQAHVKDLAKLLRRYPKGLDRYSLDRTGVRYDPLNIVCETRDLERVSR